MDVRNRLLSASERLFHRHGFAATGMDRLTEAAGLSSRTLYKHAGSKSALIAAVLAERNERFLRSVGTPSVDALFAALEDWIRAEGARGCLFLRAQAETGGDIPEIEAEVTAYRRRLRERIAGIVAAETGGKGDAELAEQILVLFEGATAAAIYRGTGAIAAARRAAGTLVAAAGR